MLAGVHGNPKLDDFFELVYPFHDVAEHLANVDDFSTELE
jgi:hypothetical protein